MLERTFDICYRPTEKPHSQGTTCSEMCINSVSEQGQTKKGSRKLYSIYVTTFAYASIFFMCEGRHYSKQYVDSFTKIRQEGCTWKIINTRVRKTRTIWKYIWRTPSVACFRVWVFQVTSVGPDLYYSWLFLHVVTQQYFRYRLKRKWLYDATWREKNITFIFPRISSQQTSPHKKISVNLSVKMPEVVLWKDA